MEDVNGAMFGLGNECEWLQKYITCGIAKMRMILIPKMH